MTIDEARNELTDDRTPHGVLAVAGSAEATEQLTTAPEISPACSGAACVDCPGADLFGKSCRHRCHTGAATSPATRSGEEMPVMFTIPDTGFTPADTWALKCDGCGQLVRAFAEFEGSGDEGLTQFRAMLADFGWTRPLFSHEDYCPTCTQQETARTSSTEPRAAWRDAHAHAVSSGVADPEQFANDYTSMLEDSQYENRYPDVPLPTLAEFIWP